MKLLRSILAMSLLAGSFSSLSLHGESGQDQVDHVNDYVEDLQEKDWRALREFINSKRLIDVIEKAQNLTISGEVGMDYRRTYETLDGALQRGGDVKNSKGFLIPRDDFDVEFTLTVDYVKDNAWAVAELKFDNSAGYYDTLSSSSYMEMFGSGSQSDIKLKKAYMGYNLYEECGTRIDLEMGRRHLYHVFDSRIQFAGRFDGIALRHETDLGCYGKLFSNTGAFVIDQRAKHFGYVTEWGMKCLWDSGVDLKVSYINWKKNGRNAVDQAPFKGSNFENVQFAAYYNLDPAYLCGFPGNFFGGVLVNTDALADQIYVVNSEGEHVYRKENLGWYAGVLIGKVRKQGDWAAGVQYQWVEAQAVPDQDMAGIGHGNKAKNMLYTNGIGSGNFKGWRVDMLYAVTDNLSVDFRWDSSKPILKNYSILVPDENNLGALVPATHQDFDYSQVKLEVIYAF